MTRSKAMNFALIYSQCGEPWVVWDSSGSVQGCCPASLELFYLVPEALVCQNSIIPFKLLEVVNA